MRIGSLFAGIGGLELGLERAGVGHTVWQVEQSDFCRQVLAKHWPDATRYEDVTTTDWTAVEPVDVLCGGFPCQDISHAGRSEGIDGPASGLWSSYAAAIRLLRPRYVVVENVAALLVRGLDRVLGDLAACGYDAEWDCVPAVAVGAPHRRDRIFVVAYPHSESVRLEPVAQRWSIGPALAGVDGPTEPVADPQGDDGTGDLPCDPASGFLRGMEPRGSSRERGGHGWLPEPAVGRVAHGLPRRLVEPQLRALGNAVVPQVAEVVGRRLLELERAA